MTGRTKMGSTGSTYWGFALALGFGAALAAGCSGSNGAAGKDGTPCSITDNHDGTATISCGDGGTFTVTNGTNGTNGMNGTNGSNGASCTLGDTDGGTRTLTCGAQPSSRAALRTSAMNTG